MENKSPIQQKSNEDKAIQKRIDTKEKVFNTVKDNLYYIYIVLMIIANCILSLLKLEDGKIGLNYPKTTLGWVLWATQILATTFVGVMILMAFRSQGIKLGHKTIKDTYNDYLKAVTSNKNDLNPRSQKQYMSSQALKDSITKGAILIMLNLLVLSLTISANWNALLALVVNIIFSVGFGIKAMLDAEEFVITELVVWYKLEIRKLIDKKENKDELLQRNAQPRTRSTRSNRVQQKKKRSTRSTNRKPDSSSERTT